MKNVFGNFVLNVLFLCFFASMSLAYEVDIEQYELGDIPEELGLVQVAMSTKLKQKTLEPVYGEKSFVSIPCNLKSPFVISFKKWDYQTIFLTLIDTEDKKYIWEIGSYLKFDGQQVSSKSVGVLGAWRTLQLKCSGRSAKFFSKNTFIMSRIIPKDINIKEIKLDLLKSKVAITDIKIEQL
ncbi:MAG: hypothetical protein GY737_17350 [Desulfobacteraceae bacterium]|nr:hypothetical protein [Desulfobacteraceae bacterium]